MAVQRLSVQDFEEFLELPENEDRIFELINGDIVEKVPSNAHASQIAFEIGYQIKRYLDDHDLEGHITGEAGGYRVSGDQYAPDVAYLSKVKQEKLDNKSYNSVPPDLVVEVETNITATSERRLKKKIVNYLRAGTTVWVLYPDTAEVEIYTPDKDTLTLGIEDTLDGGDVLPGFKIAVRKIFK